MFLSYPGPFVSCISDLWCKIDGTEVLPLEEEPLNILLPELFTDGCDLLCHLSCRLTKYTVVGFVLSLFLSLGMPEIRLDVPRVFCFVFTRPPVQI